MIVYIDADGCPVTDITIDIANKYHVEVVIVCDTAHEFSQDVKIVVVSKGPDSVDFALLKLIKAGDLVITQDYGLAALCLTKKVHVMHQDGWFYTNDTIDGLLEVRQASKKMRQSRQRVKGPSKRTSQQNDQFKFNLDAFLKKETHKCEF